MLAERQVTLHELTMTDWDGRIRSVRSRSWTCLFAGTYVRAIARDLGEAVGNAAYLGALTRMASGPFDLAARCRSTTSARPPPMDRKASCRSSGRSTMAWMLPGHRVDEVELAAVARGQYVRPVAGLPAPRADHYRLRGPDGRLAAIASADGIRLAPDKVFVSPVAAPAAATAG